MRRALFATLALALLITGGCAKRTQTIGEIARPGIALPLVSTSSKRVALGSFNLQTDKMLVSDPCYTLEAGKPVAGYQKEIKGAITGVWKAESLDYEAGPGDVRSAELRAYHEKHAHPGDCEWKLEPTLIGVDSGQAGFFDRKYFRDQKVVPKNIKWRSEMIDPDDRWYSMSCELTLSKTAGVIPFGVVAGSGFGDGGYDLFICRNKAGKPQGVRLVFITDQDVK